MTEREEARDPNTSAERFLVLVKSSDEEVLRALACNPNAPLDTLDAAWRKFPQGFLQNPAVSLFQLENPNFYSQLTMQTVAVLLTLPDISESLIHFAWEQHRTPFAEPLSKHPRTPPEVLDGMIELYTAEQIVTSIATHTNTSSKTIERIIGEGSHAARLLALSHPALAEDLVPLRPVLEAAIQKRGDLRGLSLSQLCSVARCGYIFRIMVARIPEIPGSLIVAMLFGNQGEQFEKFSEQALPLSTPILGIDGPRRPGRYIMESLAEHPNAPDAFLRWLASQKSIPIMTALAKNPNAPKDLLLTIAKTKREDTKIALLSNPNLPEEILLSLLSDENSRVVALALNHTKATPAMVASIFTPEKAKVRRAIAAREETPAHILARLFDTDDHSVRIFLNRNRNTPKERINLVKRLESQGALTEDEVRELSQHHGYLRELLSLHPQAPQELIEEALRSPSVRIRLTLTKRSKDPNILEQLARDEETSVSRSAKSALEKLSGVKQT
jgi:hypothetical protein